MVDATSTKTALPCNSLNLDHVTLFMISSQDSLIYVVNFSMVFYVHGWRDSNSQPTVLETATLPIELHPFIFKAFATAFSVTTQSLEPHPSTQPKRTAKVEQKA